MTTPRLVLWRSVRRVLAAAFCWWRERGQRLGDDAHPAERELFDAVSELRADIYADPTERARGCGPHFNRRALGGRA